ncbi:hypothetical protein [Alteromonas gracilis]|uniref:hypothetical protein n=1 Tax=Alteromonas gracilis TaxID=1479524 RepID=UPI003736C7BF
MSTLNTNMNAIKVTFDSGDIITGRVTVEDDVVFRGAVAPQLVSIEFDDFKGNSEHTVESLKETITCSANETYKASWHSDIWGFEYSIFTL